MSTEKTLEKLIDFADSALNNANKSLVDLFSSMLASSKDMEYVFDSNKKEIIDSVKYYGNIYDAATYVKSKLIDPKSAKHIELKLTGINRNIESLNTTIKNGLAEHNSTDKEYVYMAWKNRPEEYFYVGRAKSKSRTNLASHGNLLESLKQATFFSILIPPRSNKETIDNLEAAIITLIEYKTGVLPKYNKKMPKFKIDNLDCADERDSLFAMFSKLALEIQP